MAVTLIVGVLALLPGNEPRLISVMLSDRTVHVPVPLQAGVPPPLQPANVEPAAGVAVSVMALPTPVKDAVQVPPQSMPPGALVTVPEPVPVLLAVIVGPSLSELAESMECSDAIAAAAVLWGRAANAVP